MKPPNLLLYSDYRKFLRDYYDLNKSGNPAFSYRYMSMRAGINSSAFYKYVIDGARNLSKASILKTCMMLKLQDRDAEYFENLVFFNQAATVHEKNLFFDRLTQLRGDFEQRKVEESQYSLYGDWVPSAVRELLNCVAYKGDDAALAALLVPPVAPDQVGEAIRLLARLGLIRRDAQGRWKQADAVLTTGGQTPSPVVVGFQRRMIALALDAFDAWPREERLMSTLTVSISEETRDLIKRRLREVASELLELARRDDRPRRVYQLNLNLFPLSRAREGRKA